MTEMSPKIAFIISLLAAVVPASVGSCQEDRPRYATADSRSDYVHRIELFDKNNSRILPGEGARPYSPKTTCGKCHDYKHIATGYHFNPDAAIQDHGRAGETWIWVDPSTGTQLPVSYRSWPGSYTPANLGISDWEFVWHFGGRTPGGYPGLAVDRQPGNKDPDPKQTNEMNRFHLSGELDIDCMICHARNSAFDIEAWSKQIDDQNFSWASTAAIGLASIDGQVRRLKDDFDVQASLTGGSEGPGLPATSYDPSRFDADGHVFFDIVRFPSNNACYRCHSNLTVGLGSSPRWTHDQDVHLRAGMKCVDCHRNGLGHTIVRGFEGEVHPQQEHTANLSCVGCHMASGTSDFEHQKAAGRMGAPYPQHKGLPPIHLQRLSCTACHAGPLIGGATSLVQTALAHQLGRKDIRKADQQPEITQPVLQPDGENVLYPYRMFWPSYWGTTINGEITPLNPNDVRERLRSTLRVRSDFKEEMTKVRLSRAQRSELLGPDRAELKDTELTTEEQRQLSDLERKEGLKAFQEKMEKALLKLKEDLDGRIPVYVSGLEIYQLNAREEIETVENQNVTPYSWPIGHDVRPARWALGANGCDDCHSEESPFFYADVAVGSPTPQEQQKARPMHEYANLDAALLGTWNQSFRGRTAFKWMAFVSVASVTLVVVVFVLFSFAGILKSARRRG